MDPITLAIAGAVATGVVTRAGELAGTALSTLFGRIRDRFRDRPEELESPESTAAALETEFTRDPAFRQDCHALWNQAQSGGVANSFNGQANKVIQARDIHGNITF
ncbi:hypothetical protein FDA94_05085 [Herbidospora galbida]|uniref:Uncharacterized protein n=1 Tax=Herbidospora galbida TaxID=2575442 RepID=A0A4U3MNW4_9ACTN|nr:hypothetical protein [Herbidospora galbida]TKK90382.1 hypothetical protein FDA94_05085 [Herbidospora galbida]